MRFLRESAVEQVMLGKTTLREINKGDVRRMSI
jgi:hypothetical protein